ncbi:hypothetical protein BD309DRAFT_479486 [Dichomitus squalens]|nr:hypothetical protein BD309DRAFT_479486 [Dichomitus squalens]
MSAGAVTLAEGAGKVVEDHYEAIEEHYKAIVELKRHLNNMTSISRFLNEILLRGFAHVARGSFGAFTHVCHRWRIIAHDSPRLWCYLILTEQQSATKFLHRS